MYLRYNEIVFMICFRESQSPCRSEKHRKTCTENMCEKEKSHLDSDRTEMDDRKEMISAVRLRSDSRFLCFIWLNTNEVYET